MPGISYPIECVYTQSHGVQPDVALLTCNPQAGAFPRLADLTLTWDATSIVLPNCQLDLARISYGQDRFRVTIPALDRRWKWEFAAPVSGYYNVKRVNAYIVSYQKNLRQLITLLLTALGEASIDVSAVPTDIYPEVRWDCHPTRKALEELTEAYGLGVVVNFGTEPVYIVQLGSGTTLPSTNIASPTLTFDPKIRPRYIRVCYGPTMYQARFLCEPVGREIDGTWVDPSTLTYEPSGGWVTEDPEILPATQINQDADTYNAAVSTVFRAYRIKAFSQDNLIVPGLGSSEAITLSDINQVLPLLNRLLSGEYIRSDGSGPPIRVWARHDRKVREKGQPEYVREQVDETYEITRYQYYFDGESGYLVFDEPLFYVDDTGFQFATVYIETSFSLTDETTNSPEHYESDVSFDTSGVGYLTHRVPERRREIIVSYAGSGSGASYHIPSGVSDNKTSLDTEAAAIAAALSTSMYDTAGEDIVYSIPKLDIRLDGRIRQVQHIMTEGEGRHAVNRTRASRFIEFDRGVPSRSQRVAHAQAVLDAITDRWQNAIQKRRDRADD